MAAIPLSGTTSDEFTYNSADSTFAFFGDFGGGTVTTDLSFDNGTTWIPIKKYDGSVLEVTENEVHIITVGRCLMRFVSTSGTTNISVAIA
jgi:hypothetical protein